MLTVWDEVTETLAWWGILRRPDETYPAYGRRAGRELYRLLGPTRDPSVLAASADEAAFAGPHLPNAVVQDAQALGDNIRQTLDRAMPAGRRLRWAINFRMAWSPVLVGDTRQPPGRPVAAVD